MHRSFLIAAVAGAAAAFPALAAAQPASDVHLVHHGAAAKKPAAPGVVFGGRTAQSWPVVIETSHDLRQIVRADIGLHLACTSGSISNQFDSYVKLPLSTTGSFSGSFAQQGIDFGNGHKGDYSGTMKGKLNARLTSGSGTWSLKFVEHDATGAVVDTCDSKLVKWKVKQ
jgi:hypothetical protein